MVIVWNVVPYGSCENIRFGGMFHLHLQGKKAREVYRYCYYYNLFESQMKFYPVAMVLH
jgi:hypothetical protein